MATQAKLENLYSITDNSYTTGSESLDGLLIGLATWLIIRNSEFIILDILTFLFGDRKHRIAYRVLRTWELLNLFHFYTLLTGFDTDLPRVYLPLQSKEKHPHRAARVPVTATKASFRWLLVFSVILGKLLVLGAEVAIIAFIIPVPKIHTSDGGLGFRWRNTTVTEQSIRNLPVCHDLVTSDILADTAQVVLCKRVEVAGVSEPLPQKWIPNASLRLEEIFLTPQNIDRFGGEVLEDGLVSCKGVGSTDAAVSVRQTKIDDTFSVQWENTIATGEVAVSGMSAQAKEGFFLMGTASLLPLFSDVKTTVRLAFPEFWKSYRKGEKGIALNGKLLFGAPFGGVTGRHSNSICPDAINEVMRVTGTLHPGLLLDVIRSGITVNVTDSFAQPSLAVTTLQTVSGYEIGKSRKYRIQPEWMGVTALIIVLLSAITSRLNKTKARMARVYREHNEMLSACSPSYLEKEVVVESALFRNEDQFHWGSDPGWPWYQVPLSELHPRATLV